MKQFEIIGSRYRGIWGENIQDAVEKNIDHITNNVLDMRQAMCDLDVIKIEIQSSPNVIRGGYNFYPVILVFKSKITGKEFIKQIDIKKEKEENEKKNI